MIVTSTIGFTGYVLLATCNTVGVRYFGVFLAAAGIFPTIANILPWVLSDYSFPCNSESFELIVFYFQTIKARILAVVLGSPSCISSVNVGRSWVPTSSPIPKVHGTRGVRGSVPHSPYSRLCLRWVCGSYLYGRIESWIFGVKSEIPLRNGIDPASMQSAIGEENYGPNFRFVL